MITFPITHRAIHRDGSVPKEKQGSVGRKMPTKTGLIMGNKKSIFLFLFCLCHKFSAKDSVT